jgi:hypothetical protein
MTAPTPETRQTLTTDEPIGVVTVGRTVYTVYRLPVAEASRAAGVANRFAMEGPKGAAYLVTDWGVGYRINSVRVSRSCAPRPLRDLTREHLAAFGVEVR